MAKEREEEERDEGNEKQNKAGEISGEEVGRECEWDAGFRMRHFKGVTRDARW